MGVTLELRQVDRAAVGPHKLLPDMASGVQTGMSQSECAFNNGWRHLHRHERARIQSNLQNVEREVYPVMLENGGLRMGEQRTRVSKNSTVESAKKHY